MEPQDGPAQEKKPEAVAKPEVPANSETKAEPEATPLVTYNDFKKIDLRVAQIMVAERIEKSEKLVRLQIDLGETLGKRQILAGIAKHYTPEELVGRKIAVVANLQPAKLMGELSQGMLLAASDDAGNLELISVGTALPPGSVIR